MEPIPPLWRDRQEAGQKLAQRCRTLAGQAHTLLVGLPRGGVEVAAVMARQLRLPLACWAVRKLADPAWPEVAIGAVAPGGVVLWADGGRVTLPPNPQRLQLVREQQQELRRRQQCYRDPQPRALTGRHLVVVDDGIATGLTARAALLSLRPLRPASITLAVPVMDAELVPVFEALVERLEVLAVVPRLEAVGLWYANFPQLDDATVVKMLRASQTVGPA
jgi:putative phosphoribosyl transferase